MVLRVEGFPSGYELEHTARIFFPDAQLIQTAPAARLYADAVFVRLSGRRILCGVRQNGLAAVRELLRGAWDEAQLEYQAARLLFLLLCEATGKRPPWGMLTGVRPVRIFHDKRRAGETEADIERWYTRDYFVSEEKFKLARTIAGVQEPVMTASVPRSYSLYVSIPFCPSRCSYCSFVSRTTAQSAKLIEPYVEALRRELLEIAAVARRNRLRLETIYIGGGTPTALSAAQLRRLMECIRDTFDVPRVREYTVEAGRPDCTTPEKLTLLKELGATRISINPQTLSDEVLRAIGRRHTAQDILDCFASARAAGHQNINMDLIAGLPLDTQEGFEKSLAGVMALAPENITVHTLTLKRASNLVIEHKGADCADPAAMVSHAHAALGRAGYLPYYLYRQKGTLGNLENTGYTRPGFPGLYNVYIMEEVHTILSAGAGGSTKLVAPGGRIERIFNHKYPFEYLERFDVVRQRKQGVDAFYGKYFDLDSETSGGAGPAECGGADARGADCLL